MFGVHEQPSRSISTHIDSVDFPATRDDIATAAAEGDAPAAVINVLRCLPRQTYERREDVLRDLAEAARRYAFGPSNRPDPLRDRRDIGRNRNQGRQQTDGVPK